MALLNEPYKCWKTKEEIFVILVEKYWSVFFLLNYWSVICWKTLMLCIVLELDLLSSMFKLPLMLLNDIHLFLDVEAITDVEWYRSVIIGLEIIILLNKIYVIFNIEAIIVVERYRSVIFGLESVEQNRFHHFCRTKLISRRVLNNLLRLLEESLVRFVASITILYSALYRIGRCCDSTTYDDDVAAPFRQHYVRS